MCLLLHVNMDRFPIIKRVNESLLGDERFNIAHPNNQPDCPDNNLTKRMEVI